MTPTDNNPLSLKALNTLVKRAIEGALTDEYWVVAELSDASHPSLGGHFYGELVEKDAKGANVARARVNCWASTYNYLRVKFSQAMGSELAAGMKVMVRVRVTFNENFGYSLNIRDIDPTYTLGDLARRRQLIIDQLTADGIIDDNKRLPLAANLQRIAIISAEGAAGYGDFVDQLQHNAFGLAFRLTLFSASLQGVDTVPSVLRAMEEIASRHDEFDAMVIIRGGGATSDLASFDSYELAAALACMPLPVIVGIGHERDETVLDYVAHTRVKTPTAAAAFIIDHQTQQLAAIDALQRTVTLAVQRRLAFESQRFQRLAEALPLRFATVRERQEARIARLHQRLTSAIEQGLTRRRHRLDLLEARLAALDPALLLSRGYSMTLHDGRIVTDAQTLRPGDVITTRLHHGTLQSTVNPTKQ